MYRSISFYLYENFVRSTKLKERQLKEEGKIVKEKHNYNKEKE